MIIYNLIFTISERNVKVIQENVTLTYALNIEYNIKISIILILNNRFLKKFCFILYQKFLDYKNAIKI